MQMISNYILGLLFLATTATGLVVRNDYVANLDPRYNEEYMNTDYATNDLISEESINSNDLAFENGKFGFLMPKVSPNRPELYLCTPIKVDFTENYFIVGYEPNATMNTAHHMLLYGCGNPGSSKETWNCGEMAAKTAEQTSPPCDSSSHSQIMYAWARDAPALDLPQGVGFKVGRDSPIKYMVLQVHYANVDRFKNGATDDSGVFIKYTTKPLRKQAGVLLMEKCTGEGFMADPNNCRKFYRCTKNGDKYEKHEFKCAKGTAWSEENQTCVHAGDVDRCYGQTEEPELETTTTSMSEEWTSTTEIPMTKPPAKPPTKPTTQKPQIKPTTSTQSPTKPTYKPTTQTPTMPTMTTESSTEYTTLVPVTSTRIPNIPPGTKCSGEGFMADPQNCRKFYRCIKEGDSYSKHEFMCGKGTGWSEEKQTCDHASNIDRCDGQTEEPEYETTTPYEPVTNTTPSSTTSTQKPTTSATKPTEKPQTKPTQKPTEKPQTKPTPMPSKEPATESSKEPEPKPTTQKPTQSTTSTTPEYITIMPTTTPVPIPNLPPGTVCSGEGFMADPENCRKFYRCIKEGDSYSKHEFMCGKGTGWSEEKQTCDHAGNIDRCAGQQEEPETTISYPTASTTISSTSSSTSPNSPSTATESTSTPCPTPTTEDYSTTTMEPINFNCTSEGFFPDEEDCNRYYRCVDADMNGNYQIYSFRCPKGTVWDSSLDTCNYADKVSGNCSSGTTTEYPYTTTAMDLTTSTSTQPADTTTTTSTTTTTRKPTTTTSTTTTTTAAPTTSTTSTTTTTAAPTSTTTPPPTTTTTPPTTTTTTTPAPTSTTTNTKPTTTTTPIPSTTTIMPTGNGSAPCPPTSTGQNLFVCPTGFKRHPEQCDMFYQCSEKPESHDYNVVVFECPPNTVFYEDRCKCDKPSKNDQCLNKIMTRNDMFEEFVRRGHMIKIRSTDTLCPAEGHFTLNDEECSPLFVRCTFSEQTGRLEGRIQRCPKGFGYWAVSRRCEKAKKLSHCKPAKYDINSYLPTEWANLGNRRRNLFI